MSSRSRSLFHSRIAPLLNLQRLSAHRVLSDVLAMDLPLPSQEGFVRQVLGWREFVRHVHEATDGFRVVRGVVQPSGPGDGGSRVSFLGAARPLPPAFWGKRSGLACLDEVVAGVWQDGTSHHITRLMVLSQHHGRSRRARAVPTLALQGSGTAVDSIERRPGVERLAQGVEMLVERRQVEA